MKNKYTKSITNKLYLILFLGWISISQSSCLINYYSPSTTLSFTGTTSYCQGAVATPNTLNYDQCTLGGGLIDNGVPYTAQWYYNTTGSTSIPLSTALGAPIAGTSPTSGPGIVNYTPVTTSTGTYYYFCYITWAVAGTCTSTYTSTTQTINITPPAAAITGTASVCIGSTTTLATSVSGGTWSSSATAVATVVGGVVSGITAGTAVISYSISGCVSTRIVTVNAAPAAIAPAAPITICQGATTTFSDPTAGGTWTSSAPGTASVSAGGVVTGVAGGTATITYTLTSTGCYSTKNITINPTPLPITGVTQVCPLGTTTLSDPSPGGVWSSVSPAIATIDLVTGVVSGVAAGTTTISYTGCGSATITVSVHASPAPITGSLFACPGTTTTLSSLTLGGTWSSSSPANATATTSGPGTGLITGVALGTTNITYTSTLACITTAQVTVTPMPDVILGSVPICVGNSMTLTNSVPGGTWISTVPGIASISSSGFVSGLSAGVTTISYLTGCGLATVGATVNAIPAPIVGQDTVCVGSNTVLASATIGGTWSSGTPSVATVLLTSGVVTGLSTGVTLITYTMPGGCIRPQSVEVLPAMPAITGTMELCPNTTTTLANAIPGGNWSSASLVVATVNPTTGKVTGVSAETTTITYAMPWGCSTMTTITVNPLPDAIVGDVVPCATDIDTLYDPTPGGLWSSITPTVATIDPITGIVTTLTTGTATIRYTLPTGCFVSKSFHVKPIPGPIVTYEPDLNTFFTASGFVSYQWYDSVQGLIPGAITNHTAALYFGYYYVVVTDTNGCSAASAHHPYNKTIGFDQPTASGNYRIFPNPTSEMVYIEAPAKVRAVVSSIDGKSLIDVPNAKQVDISKLANGMYLISLFDENGTLQKVHKLIKQ